METPVFLTLPEIERLGPDGIDRLVDAIEHGWSPYVIAERFRVSVEFVRLVARELQPERRSKLPAYLPEHGHWTVLPLHGPLVPGVWCDHDVRPIPPGMNIYCCQCHRSGWDGHPRLHVSDDDRKRVVLAQTIEAWQAKREVGGKPVRPLAGGKGAEPKRWRLNTIIGRVPRKGPAGFSFGRGKPWPTASNGRGRHDPPRQGR
jgi:hypothetical protein